MPNPKVPDAVLEAAMASADLPEQARERMRIALEAALAQHHKELLGDEAAEAAARLFLGHERHLRTDMDEFRAQLQAAIDSVMKGGNGG